MLDEMQNISKFALILKHLQVHFIKHKLWISEEWYSMYLLAFIVNFFLINNYLLFQSLEKIKEKPENPYPLMHFKS